MNKRKLTGNLLLLIAAAVWGGGYIANDAAIQHIGVFTYEMLRMFLGGLILLPVCMVLRSGEKKRAAAESTAAEPIPFKLLFAGGILCGMALVFASALQGFGLLYTTPGKGSFIAALYIVIVPIITSVLHKKLPGVFVWAGIGAALAGFALLSLSGEEGSINPGDLIMLACAAVYSVQICLLEHFSPKVNGVYLACAEFFTASVTALVFALIFDDISLATIADAALPLLYSSVVSCCIGFTLQSVALRMTDASVGSLIMSLESVFALLLSWLITSETLLPREYLGCFMVFAAVILSQLPELKKR
ncbi:MAG: DMT family transporter [Clostridia bacterium]|nr:DMT family transporter [Clostridia bacterium]